MVSRFLVLLMGVMLIAGVSAWGEAASPGHTKPEAQDPQETAEQRERRISARTERARREAWFNQLDRDGDGYLSNAELAAKHEFASVGKTLDRDDDGRVSRTEFASLEAVPERRPGEGP